MVKQRLLQLKCTPYAPDLASCNFFLFPKIHFKSKVWGHGRHSKKYDGSASYLLKEEFQNRFNPGKIYRNKVVESQEAYFEEN